MRRAKGLAAIVLSIALAFTLLPTTVLAAGEVCEIGATQYTDLATALDSIPAGGSATIKLLTNINHTSTIVVDNKSVTFDLNGYTLNVTVSSGNALTVQNAGNVTLTGEGAFNVTTTGGSANGVFAAGGCTATVTNATSQYMGVYASGGTITVKGNAAGSSYGAYVGGGGNITVEGNVSSTGNVNVVQASSGTILVKGDVIGTGSAKGVYADGSSSTVTVLGNISVSTAGGFIYGVSCNSDAKATVEGTITASRYISVNGYEKSEDQGVDGTGADAGYKIYTEQNAKVRVRKVVPTYALTVDNGTGDGSYAAGATVGISADTPPTGKVFDHWTTSGGGTFASAANASTTFTMPAAAVTVTPVYADQTYILTMVGGTDTTNAGPYTALATVNISANTAPAGKVFHHWSSSGGTFASTTSATTTFTMPAAAATVTANFADTYAIAVQNDGNGTGSANPASATQGQTVALSNTPASHYHFKEWQVISPAGLSIVNNSFTMPAEAVTVKAIFEADTYAIAVQNDGNGTGSANPTSAAQGQTVTLSTTPASQYHFKQWQVISPSDLSIVNNSFTMPAETVTVKAIFEADAPVTYTVTFNNDGTTYTSKAVPVNTSIGSANWPAAPSKSEFTFGGWFTGLNGNGTQLTDTTTVTASITVYAKWTAISLSGGLSAPPPLPPAPAIDTVTNRAGETISAPATVTGQAVVNNQPINLGLLSNGQESTQSFTQSLSTSNKDRNVILTLYASPLGQPVEGGSTQYSAQQMEIGAGAATQLRANDITHIAFSVGNATATIPTASLSNPALRNIATRAGGTLAEAAFRVELVPAQLTDAQKEALRGIDMVESFYLRVTMVVNGKQIDVTGRVSGIRAQIQTDVYSRNGRIGIFSGNRFTRLSATTSKNAAGEGLFNTAVNRSGLFIVTE